MEEKLVKIFKLANLLNEKQDNVYAQIQYTADNNKTLEICIRSKYNFSFLQQLKVQLSNETIINLDNIIELFNGYIGGACNE